MNSAEICALLLFFIGVYGVVARKNIIKTILSVCIMETAVILFFLSINFNFGMTPPIGKTIDNASDPFVQALMITAIVIGVAVTAFATSIFIGIYHKYGTTNWSKAKEIREKEEGI